ncbi:class I SAM-dependent methyltransferase [Telmatocola sphagniphila]|uniref:Class I SAM-dependent methyltransferase n=1 Tax=Telmatocola sphagniphila TaxID=1123043 RepID=A0A8E6B6A1_9BACT|nr:class I SAM-dependent methyltransferase [Telmatocola sphagniphila]QVL32521.1 class I SAM-dependent methyltransferase [Telmatocola sphagniphila]
MPDLQAADSSPFDDGELYDLLFENFDYGLEYYLDLARRANGPILDIACGTGRIMIPCLQAGLEVEGLDLSAGMLQRLQSKAEKLGYKPTLHQASMNDFKIDRKFQLIVIAFNAFIHNMTTSEQIATLALCREHLVPGGMLAFDSYFPGAHIITAVENTRVLEMEKTDSKSGNIVRIFDTRAFNRVEQIQNSINEIEILDSNRNLLKSHLSKHSVRWIYKGEMQLLLKLAGFPSWSIYGGFDLRPLEQETDSLIVEAYTSSLAPLA